MGSARLSGPGILSRLDGAWRASLVVALAYLALCVAGALQTGASWDEFEHRLSGELTLDFYRTLGAERGATTYWTNYYGSFHALVGAAAERLFPSLPWPSARHLGTVAFALLGFVYTVRLARLLAGPWAGFVAALLLATTPRWTGDAMFNPVDIPAGAMHVVGLYTLARIVGAPEKAGLVAWARFGLAAGLTLAVRAVGFLLFFYAVLALAAWVLGVRPRAAVLRAHGARIAVGFALATTVAAVVALALWPRLLVEPVATLTDTLLRTNSYPWPGSVLFRGVYYSGHELPSSYLAVWFWISTPLATLLGLGLAVASARAWLPFELGAWLRAALVVFAVLFPPCYATLQHATIYDGIRHFLFVLPPLVVLAAAGWSGALARVARLGRRVPLAVGALLAATVAEPALWYVRSHPYEYTYFNPLVGGLARASHGYDTDYWGLSLRSAAETLTEYRRELLGPEGRLVFMTNAPWHLFEPWLDDPSKYEKIGADDLDKPHQVLLLWYRTLPVGWELDPVPVRTRTVVAGQVPFWQAYLVPRFTAGLPPRGG